MSVVVAVVFTSLEAFHSLLFDVIPHPSVSYRRVFTSILYFQLNSSQSDLRHFRVNFSELFFFNASGFEQAFFTHRYFLPYTPSFVTQMGEGTPHPGSSSVPALTKLPLPTDA